MRKSIEDYEKLKKTIHNNKRTLSISNHTLVPVAPHLPSVSSVTRKKSLPKIEARVKSRNITF